jgi:leader peptidase (prepilin peptidase)/N-methyltransferase
MGESLAGLILAGAAGGAAVAFGLSWLALRGRPRSRSATPAVALATALAGCFLGPGTGSAWAAGATGAFLAFVVWAAVVDLRERAIPNTLTYPGTVAALAAAPLALAHTWTATLLGAGFMLLLYLPAALLPRRWLGMGDVKLALVLGLFLGFPLAMAAALGAALLGAGAAVVFLLRGRGRSRDLPYGPCLAAGAIAALVLGQALPAAFRLAG